MFGDRKKNVRHQKTTEEKKGVEYKVSSLICGKNDLETWCVENGLEYILFEKHYVPKHYVPDPGKKNLKLK